MWISLWFHSIIFTYGSWAGFVGVRVTCFIFSGETVIGTGFTPLVSACSRSVCVTDYDSGDSLMRSPQIGQPCWTHLLHACMLSRFSLVRLFVTLWTIAHQAPVSMEFSRQEYWSGLPFPSPGDLPDPAIKPMSLALQAGSLPSEPPGKPKDTVTRHKPRSWGRCAEMRVTSLGPWVFPAMLF